MKDTLSDLLRNDPLRTALTSGGYTLTFDGSSFIVCKTLFFDTEIYYKGNLEQAIKIFIEKTRS